MTTVFTAFASALFLLVCSSTASSQVIANPGPVVYGHTHLNVSSLDAHKKFWVALGGTVIRLPNKEEAIKFPGTLIFLRVQKPTGGSKGTTVNHIGFGVPNLPSAIASAVTQGIRDATAQELMDPKVKTAGFVFAPDDLKVELLDTKAQAAPIVSRQVHFYGPQHKEMRDWYVKVFGAQPQSIGRDDIEVANLPGLQLLFQRSPDAQAGTKDRVLDHIGFEVKNLAQFTKNLEAQGIKLAVPLRRVEALNISSAFITDPWGTYIELTEGLDKIF